MSPVLKFTLGMSLIFFLITSCFHAIDSWAFESSLGKELDAALEQYHKEVSDLPGEEVHTPGTDSQMQAYLDLALEKSLDIHIAEKMLHSDEEQLRAARGGLFPQFGVRELYDHEEEADTYITQLRLSQAIWNGQLWGSYRQEQAAVLSSGFSHDLAYQTLEYNVARAYFNLIRLDETVEENIDNVKQLSEHLGIARSMLESGSKTKADMLCVEVTLAAGKNASFQSILSARNQVVALNKLLRRPLHSEIRIRELGKIKLFVPDIDSCLAIADTNRPDIKMQEAGVRAAEVGVMMARQNFLPTVSLVGTYGSTETDEISFSDPELGIQAEFDVTIFTSGKNRALLSSARLLRETELARLKSIREQVASEITSTVLTISTAISQIHVLRRKAEAVGEKLKMEHELYARGLLHTTDFMESMSDFVNARGEFIDAIYGYQMSMSQLRQQLGGADFPMPAALDEIETLDLEPMFRDDKEMDSVF